MGISMSHIAAKGQDVIADELSGEVNDTYTDIDWGEIGKTNANPLAPFVDSVIAITSIDGQGFARLDGSPELVKLPTVYAKKLRKLFLTRPDAALRVKARVTAGKGGRYVLTPAR